VLEARRDAFMTTPLAHPVGARDRHPPRSSASPPQRSATTPMGSGRGAELPPVSAGQETVLENRLGG
jgi:hypothetical protein